MNKAFLRPKKTNRGFALYEFTDHYGTECSVQKSSLATDDAIWLGVTEAKLKQLIRNEGWKDFELPKDVEVFSRMHLTRNQIKELLPILQKFVKTGEI